MMMLMNSRIALVLNDDSLELLVAACSQLVQVEVMAMTRNPPPKPPNKIYRAILSIHIKSSSGKYHGILTIEANEK